ncbi:hypothetical protein IWX90DRAFT_492845 [Phyllosticta citrichinensis]|uniref:AMP-activated protein kinase glycogen-binding domain-containing protein n=1 Tax=Phyllosticta citrichinensis TaxID=1130410 RepID=A0ABR1Y7J3_9PEZI
MGSYTFRWEHPATSVHVTGTFDDWAKSVELDKQPDGAFEKTVDLPGNDEKVQYKFVVDGNWVTNQSAPQEDDGHGIFNNVLYPSDLKPSSTQFHTMSSAAPDSTTAHLAGEQPKETPGPDSVPGAFIETPANETQQFSVKPIPASDGDANPIQLAPGEPVPDPSTITSNTIQSTVKDDEELKKQDEGNQTFGINPLPASDTAANPVKLAPGEKIPNDVTAAKDINSHATLDKESYEKGASVPPQLGPVVTPEKDQGPSLFDIPGLTSTTIPESSLPIGGDVSVAQADPGVAVQSVHPESTTAALAGQVPKEPRSVPEVVSESQEQAHAAPEASANSTAVDEKKQVEQELHEKVPEKPAAAENETTGEAAGKVAGSVVGGLAAAGAVAGGAAYVAGSKAAETVNEGAAKAKETLNSSTSPTNDLKELASNAAANGSASKGVPEPVSDSFKDAHASPEAASNAEAVSEKKDVEKELLSKVPESNATGQLESEFPGVPAAVSNSIEKAHESPEAVANPEAVADKREFEDELKHKGTASLTPAAASTAAVPDVVKESIAKADEAPEAATNPEAIKEKSDVEKELKKEVKPTDEVADPAPTESAALATTAPAPITASAAASDAPANGGLNASAEQPAQTNATKSEQVAKQSQAVSAPNNGINYNQTHGGTENQTKPTVTEGTGETTAVPTKSGEGAEEPQPEGNDAASHQSPPGTAKSDKGAETVASEERKKKRKSFFGRLKEKFTSHKD